jgi:hypothetical protein
MKALLNQSNNRQSWDISCFSKIFFGELYNKYKLEPDFWNQYLLNLYFNDYSKFEDYIKKHVAYKDDYELDKNDVPTIIVNNWRFNQKLINYIIESNPEKKYINGKNDKFIITEIDDEDIDHIEIDSGCFGQESFRASVSYDQIIDDLTKMIFNKYDKVEIEQYLNNIPMYKYTKKILQNPSIELEDDEYY